MPYSPFRWIVLALVLGIVATSSVYRFRAQQVGGDKLPVTGRGAGYLVPLRLIGSALFVGFLAYLINPRWMTWSFVPLPSWFRWIGVAVLGASVVVLGSVLRSLGTNITPTVVTRREHALVTSGPYRWVRHPLYAVGGLMWLAIALVTTSWFFVAAIIPGVPLIGRRARMEEEHLIERFGDAYREYARRTGRFLPRKQANRAS